MSVTIYVGSMPYSRMFWSQIYRPAVDEDSTSTKLLKNAPVSFLAGATSGGICSFFGAPFEFAKLASQIELLVLRSRGGEPSELARTGTVQVAKELYKKGGIRALYGGFRYQLIRDIFGSGVYFAAYEVFKNGVTKWIDPIATTPHPVSVAIAGAMSGSVSWVVVYPLDTFKSVVQRDIYAHSLDPGASEHLPKPKRMKFSQMVHPRMYRGLGLSIARTSVIGMTFFSLYEQLLKHM